MNYGVFICTRRGRENCGDDVADLAEKGKQRK